MCKKFIRVHKIDKVFSKFRDRYLYITKLKAIKITMGLSYSLIVQLRSSSRNLKFSAYNSTSYFFPIFDFLICHSYFSTYSNVRLLPLITTTIYIQYFISCINIIICPITPRLQEPVVFGWPM